MLDLEKALSTLLTAGRQIADAKHEAHDAVNNQQNREEIEEVNGLVFIRQNGRLRPPALYPECQKFSGLDSVLSYRRYLLDNLGRDRQTLFDVDRDGVYLFCAERYGHFVYKPILAASAPPRTEVPLGRFQPIEEFMLMLKTCFVADAARDNLISVVGNVKFEDGIHVNDDGVSQEVSARTGVHFVEKLKLPSDLSLTRFESFPEIQDKIPARPYFLRLKVEGDEKKVKPVAALFGVADPTVDLQIRHHIKAYLVEKLIKDDGLNQAAADNMVLV